MSARASGVTGRAFRAEDGALLRRLEDEAVLEALFRHHTAYVRAASFPSPRASGLVALLRKTESPMVRAAMEAALGGQVHGLAGLLEHPLAHAEPALLHHLALYWDKVADALSASRPEAAATAWARALHAWLLLDAECNYLAALDAALLGARSDAGPPPYILLLDALGRRASTATRELAPAGASAMLALMRVPEVACAAGVAHDVMERATRAASAHRRVATDLALGFVREALDVAEAHVDQDAVTSACSAGQLLLRAVDVWGFAGRDEEAERFVVDRLTNIAWRLYRAKAWEALRELLAPFFPMIESLAARIEQGPSNVAFAAACAQMFVFASDAEKRPAEKRVLAERAVRVCPSHRNGRLVLALMLCREANAKMQGLARAGDADAIGALLTRAEGLYPDLVELRAAKESYARRWPRRG